MIKIEVRSTEDKKMVYTNQLLNLPLQNYSKEQVLQSEKNLSSKTCPH